MLLHNSIDSSSKAVEVRLCSFTTTYLSSLPAAVVSWGGMVLSAVRKKSLWWYKENAVIFS